MLKLNSILLCSVFPLDYDTHILHPFCNGIHIIITAVFHPFGFAPDFNSGDISSKYYVFFQTSKFPQRSRHENPPLLVQFTDCCPRNKET